MARGLAAPLADAPTLSAIAAATTLVAALELLPGIDHRSTATGLAAGLVLVGTSVSAGAVLRARRRRSGPTVRPRRTSPVDLLRGMATGFVYAAAFGSVVLTVKGAWLVDRPAAAAGLLLGAAFSTALGAAVGAGAGDERASGNLSLVAFFVLLVPIPLCCAEELPRFVCGILARLPSVALAQVLLAAFSGRQPPNGTSAAIYALTAATLAVTALALLGTWNPSKVAGS